MLLDELVFDKIWFLLLLKREVEFVFFIVCFCLVFLLLVWLFFDDVLWFLLGVMGSCCCFFGWEKVFGFGDISIFVNLFSFE